MLQEHNLCFHSDIWAGKKVWILWFFSGNCQCVSTDQYPNVDREIHVCRAPLSCQVCRQPVWFCVSKISVQGAPGLECGHTLGPTAQTHHITTHRHIFLLGSSTRAPPGISCLACGSRLQCYWIPFRHAHGSLLWLPADDRAAAQLGSVMLPDTACAAGIMGLGTHVTLTQGLCKHRASALLSWTFMVPNQYFMCNMKIATILWATSNRPL